MANPWTFGKLTVSSDMTFKGRVFDELYNNQVIQNMTELETDIMVKGKQSSNMDHIKGKHYLLFLFCMSL